MRLSVTAKPQPLNIEIERTALIVVDMQNDFGSKGGFFDRIGVDISPIQAVIPPIRRVLDRSRRLGMRTIYLKMGFRSDLSDAGAAESPNWIKHRQQIGESVLAPNGTMSRVLIRDTWNTDIVRELEPQPEEIVIYKHRYSGFYQTDLDGILKHLNVKYLVFTGCTTSVCVESTIRDAMFRDYMCLLLEDCAAEPIGHVLPRSNHQASLLVTQALFGWVSTSSEFVAALELQRGPALATQG